MATAASTRKPATKTDDIDAPKKSRWATMRDQARAEHKPRKPYLFDGCDPSVAITAPESVERVTALAELVDQNGNLDYRNMRRLFAALCGDAYPRVWAVVKDEPASVLVPLINEIQDHFDAVPGDEADDLPGGA